MTIIKIRQATKKDREELLKLYEGLSTKPKKYLNAKNDSFLKVLAEPNAYIDLATINNEIAGFIAYSIRHVVRYPKPILEIEEFYVKQVHRRKGIGRKLVENVQKFANKKKAQYIFISSSKERKAAHLLYKAAGFEEYGFCYKF
ncbi:GNAT family N-acetyltransferase [Candidatus Woesearchaeota archaeon]|nr:GNAT family N-acetyltransferase [Candidatus Woesearchaeota archaeon]